MGVDTRAPENEKAAELFRLAVPRMSQHGVPPTPQNYAIWYSYVSADNPALNAEIDRLVTGKQQFTEVVTTQLYRQFLAEHDLQNIEQVRDGLSRVLGDLWSSLGKVGKDTQNFEGALGGFVNNTEKKTDLSEIRLLLEALVAETRSMQNATHSMHAHFESKSKEIEELQEQLKLERRRAITDPLTGLYNRLALIDKLNAAIIEMPDSQPPSVVMLDIDRFKSVNDNHGHLIGDRVIRFVAQSLQQNIKGKDVAARYGGEEFTLLLPSTGPKGAEAVANSVRNAVAQAQLVRADNKKPLGQITISAGVATYKLGEDLMDLINRADQALYRAKREGRNRVIVA